MSSTETGSMASKEQIVSLGWASYKAAAVLVSLVLVMVIIIMIMLIVFYQVSPNQAVVNPIIIDPTTDPLATLDDLGTLWLNTTGDNSAGFRMDPEEGDAVYFIGGVPSTNGSSRVPVYQYVKVETIGSNLYRGFRYGVNVTPDPGFEPFPGTIEEPSPWFYLFTVQVVQGVTLLPVYLVSASYQDPSDVTRFWDVNFLSFTNEAQFINGHNFYPVSSNALGYVVPT